MYIKIIKIKSRTDKNPHGLFKASTQKNHIYIYICTNFVTCELHIYKYLKITEKSDNTCTSSSQVTKFV